MDSSGRARSHALRRGRRSIPGHMYLVTTVVADRSPVFSDLISARWAARCLHDRDVSRHAQTLAHVVMPDHVHWVLRLCSTGVLAEAVRLYKAKVSVRLGRRLWQHGFHDRAIRMEEDVIAASRYIVANPLRAGLVTDIGDYPHWDAVWLTG